jgi:hypothetical protein
VPDFSDKTYDQLQCLVNINDGREMDPEDLPKFIHDHAELFEKAYDEHNITVYIGIGEMRWGPTGPFTMRIDYK